MGNKIGVFVCHCGINIASTVDIKDLVNYAKTLDGVEISKDYKYMCSDVGANLIKDSIKKNKLDGVVIACCSPRMHEHTFQGVVEEVNPEEGKFKVSISIFGRPTSIELVSGQADKVS